MAFRKKTYKKRGYAKKRRTYKKTGGKKGAIKAIVRKELSRRVETKSIQTYEYGRYVYPMGNNSDAQNIINVGLSTAFTVAQGAGQGNRIGNAITTKRLVMKGILVPTPYDNIYNTVVFPLHVKMYLFRDKTTPTVMPTPMFNGNFFQNGSSSTTFNNDLTDLVSPINTDRYSILATKTMKVGFANAGGTGNQPAYQSFANNDFKYNVQFQFDLTKHYSKRVKFNDTSLLPSCNGLYLMVCPCSATGGAIPTGNRVLDVNYTLEYKYEDA